MGNICRTRRGYRLPTTSLRVLVGLGVVASVGLLLFNQTSLLISETQSAADEHRSGHAHRDHDHSSKMMPCHAMGCGFQTGTAVSILWSDWTTTSTWSYVVTLIGMFLAGVLVELLRRLNTWAHRRYMVSSTEYAKWTVGAKLGAKLIRSSLHLAHVTVGYLVMLIVMSYNLGLFCAVMAGFGVGYFVLAENCTAPAKQF